MLAPTSFHRSVLVFAFAAAIAASDARGVALPVEGDLGVQLVALEAVRLPGAATVTVNGSAAGGHLTGLDVPAAMFVTAGLVLPVTDPLAFPIGGVRLTASNEAGAFEGSGGAGFGGAMSIQGSARVCLYGACGSTNNLANLVAPLSVVGQGGSFTVPGPIDLTVIGAPWTTGTAAVGSVSVQGGVAPLSNTAAPSGRLTLVTPIFISTNVEAFAVVPAFAFLTLHFVPEPGKLLLLGASIASLALLGVGRARR